MKISFLKIIIAVVAAAFFIWTNQDPFNHGIMHAIDLAIHEVGHVVFIPFGEFMTIAGGSLFQILVPIICCIYFGVRGEFFSAALVLMWIGNNFFDVGVYANDAVFMELPLLSFSGNEATTVHDWNYLLSKTTLLHKTNQVASAFRAVGYAFTATGIAGALYFARKTEKTEF